MTKGEEESIARGLAAVPLFASLSDRDRLTIARTGKVRPFAANEKLVVQGEKGIGFFLILSGRAEVRAGAKALATLEPGSFFGEMALFEEQPRSADVVALTAGKCLVLSRWEFWGSLSKEPEVLRTLMAVLVRRLRATSQALAE